jgi:hypothetical protein
VAVCPFFLKGGSSTQASGKETKRPGDPDLRFFVLLLGELRIFEYRISFIPCVKKVARAAWRIRVEL